MPKHTDYGIIYNWDGAPHGCSEVPQSMEAFLEKVYAPLEDTQVGRPLLVHRRACRPMEERCARTPRRLP